MRTSEGLLFDHDALYVAIDRIRRQRRIHFRDIAAEAKVTPSTLTRIGQGSKPDADSLIRLLAWLGTTDLAPFIRRAPEGAPTESP